MVDDEGTSLGVEGRWADRKYYGCAPWALLLGEPGASALSGVEKCAGVGLPVGGAEPVHLFGHRIRVGAPDNTKAPDHFAFPLGRGLRLWGE